MARRLPTPTHVVQVSSFSDGDPNHVPTHPGYQLSNPDTYMRKLATKWMETHGGGVRLGEWREYFVSVIVLQLCVGCRFFVFIQ